MVHVLPLDELESAVGALVGATAAGDALGGLVGLGVHHGHVPRAGGDAGTAAHTLVGVDGARAVLHGDDGPMRARRLAKSGCAHVAGADLPLAGIVNAVEGLPVGAEVEAVVHVDAGGGGLRCTIVLQGAHHLAALATGAASTVDLEHVGRGRVVIDLAL